MAGKYVILAWLTGSWVGSSQAIGRCKRHPLNLIHRGPLCTPIQKIVSFLLFVVQRAVRRPPMLSYNALYDNLSDYIDTKTTLPWAHLTGRESRTAATPGSDCRRFKAQPSTVRDKQNIIFFSYFYLDKKQKLRGKTFLLFSFEKSKLFAGETSYLVSYTQNS